MWLKALPCQGQGLQLLQRLSHGKGQKLLSLWSLGKGLKLPPLPCLLGLGLQLLPLPCQGPKLFSLPNQLRLFSLPYQQRPREPSDPLPGQWLRRPM